MKIGHFYNAHDRSGTGHPGRVEIIDQENDIYISITTRSLTKEEYEKGDWKNHYLELKIPTSSDVYKSVVNKRPFLGSRYDYGNIEFTNLEISVIDEEVIKIVLNNNPRLGYWYMIIHKIKKPSN